MVRFSRREHLLTETPLPGPAASLIVVKGLLSQGGARGIGVGGEVQQQQLPGEWLLVVNRVDGTIQRFAARGVDLIEPGTGLSYSCKCARRVSANKYLEVLVIWHNFFQGWYNEACQPPRIGSF